MKNILKKWIANPKVLIVVYFIFASLASIQALSAGKKTYQEGGIEHTKYNNYTIFEKSFEHLKNHQDLYVLYPEDHWDLYKYTPTFSVFFGVFNSLPDWVGLNLWNILNALLLLAAVYALPRLNNYQKGLILLIMLFELLTSMQNHQSNGLIAGLLVFAFALLEKKKTFLAVLCIVFSVYIKLFGLVGFALFLFYPNKLKAIFYTVLTTVILFFTPLLFVSFNTLIELYKSYINLLLNDHSSSYGYSVMGWLHVWFFENISKTLIVGLGVAVFSTTLLFFKKYKDLTFRLLMLCSILIWIVIFNHKAESPTFIIAMAGVAIWFVNSRKTAVNIALFLFAILFTSLSPTDLFPRYIRDNFVNPYMLKAVPCIFIWFKIIYDIYVLKSEKKLNSNTAEL